MGEAGPSGTEVTAPEPRCVSLCLPAYASGKHLVGGRVYNAEYLHLIAARIILRKEEIFIEQHTPGLCRRTRRMQHSSTGCKA